MMWSAWLRRVGLMALSALGVAIAVLIFEVFARLVGVATPALRETVAIDKDGMRLHTISNGYDRVTWHFRETPDGFRDFGPMPDDRGHFALLVGDSFTFCHQVEAVDCWSTILQEKTGHGFVNLGLTGTASISHSRVLEAHLGTVQPRIVLWQFFLNDFIEDWLLSSQEGFDAGPTAWTERWSRWLLMAHIYAEKRSRAYGVLSRAVQRVQVHDVDGFTYVWHPAWIYGLTRVGTDLLRADVAQGWEMTKEALLQAHRITAAQGASLIVLVAPARERVYWDRIQALGPWPPDFDPGRLDRLVVEFCAKNGIDVLDLYEGLAQSAKQHLDLYYRLDIHWTPVGNRVVARLVEEYLRRLGRL